jgi:RNA polymerase sigma factor (sigma-70 family)
MTETSDTDRSLIEAVRQGDAQAWSDLVSEYQGRLLKYATAHLPQAADAEDVVQEVFLAFLKSVGQFRGQTSLETYLFTILRSKIASAYCGRWSRSVCLLQDLHARDTDEQSLEALGSRTPANPSASACASQQEQHGLDRQILADSLRRLIADLKKEGRTFRDLKMFELLFYCRARGSDAARLLGVEEGLVRVFKHRCLRQLREGVTRRGDRSADGLSVSEDLLSEIWESNRPSCPKRNTLGAFLLESLDPQWFDYVDFHLTTLGCHFCRASFKDLKDQQDTEQKALFRNRVLASTVGFLSRG